ncbi:hypothetical protein CJF30_00007351 [Rutstroemia sp. NJR-2017a BBW]|nr:hypothetical protein CJF30_00007351 [Rutstroemia sp. NJR-2017a BBW]
MSAPTSPFDLAQQENYLKEVKEAFEADGIDTFSTTDKQDTLISIQSFSFNCIKDALQKPPVKSANALDILWSMFLDTAQVLEKDDPFQHKLISLLLWTKDYDSLRRSLHPTESTSPPWESYRFAANVQESWEMLDELGLTALWFLREALETDNESSNTLLPAAVIWVETCRWKLLTFSVMNRSYENHPKHQMLTPGARAQRTGINSESFTLQRWLFWRRRFQELSQHEDPSVAKEAKKGFMGMILCGIQLDYEVPGEANFNEKLRTAMAILAESERESVDGDDIDIDVNWVD